jgi:hypothetical protein
MKASQSLLVRVQGRKAGIRNLARLIVLTFASVSVGVAQQSPVQEAATQQPAVETPNAAVPQDSQRPVHPQSPQEKQLADDTAKLLQLVNELKAEMDKSSRDTLSLSVIRKSEQVEKLARKVRDEMKLSLGD